jgi:hypothetical protein
MIVTFANLETLQLALTMGVVPPAVSLAAGIAGCEDTGRVWIQPRVAPSRHVQGELRRLGVQISRSAVTSPGAEVHCWLQLLPLQRIGDSLACPDQTTVLFELSASDQLPDLIGEMLRLDNDRQSFRWLENSTVGADCRALLRVVGPPYYSLLRAIDASDAPTAPVAYVEQYPRVWVQLGFRHLLGEHIKAPEGQLLLLRPPTQWHFLPDAPFRDLYDVLEFAVPGAATSWREGELTRRLTVPLRLTRGSSIETPELWVLRDEPVSQLDALVQDADDELLGRLAFAVGWNGACQTIVLRVRPSRLPPPELVLSAIGFRPYLKLPNLFVPVGTRLYPRLRRDAVRRRLADDPAQITWLYPGPDGTFTPESLPDAAFRPLPDWIDYVLEHDHQALQAWVESNRFAFEKYLSEEEVKPGDRPGTPPPGLREKSSPSDQASGRIPAAVNAQRSDETAAVDQSKTAREEDLLVAATETAPDDLQRQLHELEEQFLNLEGGMDARQRVALWPSLARLNARLGHHDDAVLCWLNALWLAEADLAALAWSWFQAAAASVPVRPETSYPRGRSWVSRLALASPGEKVDEDDLDRLLALREPAPADVCALAAYLFWESSRPSPPVAVLSRLGRLHRSLEQHENLIPVRAVWLAWLGLGRLAGGDVLALARARDRLLERLYQNGLRPELDLPSFFRFAGQSGSQGQRRIRQWLPQLRDKVLRWIEEKGQITSYGRSPQTGAYVNLLFSYGLARLGEAEAARRLLRQAAAALQDQGEAHEFLLEAYRYRIDQALAGHPNTGPLPPEQMEYLALLIEQRKQARETQGAGPAYVIDRLRHLSRILEPEQKIDPYRHIMQRLENDVQRLLGELPDILDREALLRSIQGLLDERTWVRQTPELKAHILRIALDQAPRVGEALALEVLVQVPAVFETLLQRGQPGDFLNQAELLEKSLFVAAHFGQTEYTQQFVTAFQKLLQTQRDAPEMGALDSLAAQCFRGLRKLGMHREIDVLLHQIADLLLGGRDLKSTDAAWGTRNPQALRALLEVAAGWYYFGRDAQAEMVVQVARAVLFAPVRRGRDSRPSLSSSEVRDRTQLACAYAAAVGQGRVEAMQKRFEELFERLEGIIDVFTTNDHYSQCQLSLVDAVIRAVVGDGAGLGEGMRRWLDDDEFLVRRRIHAEMHGLLLASCTD